MDDVERVAREICIAQGYIPDYENLAGQVHWTRYIETAKAVIAVLPAAGWRHVGEGEMVAKKPLDHDMHGDNCGCTNCT